MTNHLAVAKMRAKDCLKELRKELALLNKRSTTYDIVNGCIARLEDTIETLDYEPDATHPALMAFLKWKDSGVDRPETEDYVFNESHVLADYYPDFIDKIVPQLEAMDPGLMYRVNDTQPNGEEEGSLLVQGFTIGNSRHLQEVYIPDDD